MNTPELPHRPSLILTALFRLAAAPVLIGVLVFIPAGTLRYWQGWLYLAVLLVPIAAVGIALLLKDPELMARRMNLRETEPQQKLAIVALNVVIVSTLIFSGLDSRLSWSMVPPGVVIFADVVILIGYMLFGLTIRENRFASRAVEVLQGQIVISSGPYAFVRHPMYLATTLIFGITPVALGSYWALLVSALFPVMLVSRIKNEEKVLREGLRGYDDYVRRVKWRLIPFVW